MSWVTSSASSSSSIRRTSAYTRPDMGPVEALEGVRVPAGGQGGLHGVGIVPVEGSVTLQQRRSGSSVRHAPRWIGGAAGKVAGRVVNDAGVMPPRTSRGTASRWRLPRDRRCSAYGPPRRADSDRRSHGLRPPGHPRRL